MLVAKNEDISMTTLINTLFPIFPNLILLREKKVLLLKRGPEASCLQGLWSCPAGRMEQGETPKETIIREAYEELNLHINPHLGVSLFVNARHFLNPQEHFRDLSLFFVATEFDGEPINKEPTKCEIMEWFDLHALPSPMISSVKFGLECYRKGHSYGEFYEQEMD
jgi:8-oxo-dGTP diphosphatase